MASKEPALRKLPAEQQKQLESEGRLKRIFCDVLKLRVVAYIAAQPASSLFIVALLAIAACLPAVGVHIKRSTSANLPDLFVMKNWNAYSGDLADREFCFNDSASKKFSFPLTPEESYGRVAVKLDFTVDKKLIKNKSTSKYLYASISGADVHAKIIDSKGNRTEKNVTIEIIVDTSKDPQCGDKTDSCKVAADVLITAPLDSVPSHMPYIHKNLSFGASIMNASVNHPAGYRTSLPPELAGPLMVLGMNLTTKSCGNGATMAPCPPEVARHGLITVYISEDDRAVVYTRMLVAGAIMVTVALAFAAGITFTERPPISKPSSE